MLDTRPARWFVDRQADGRLEHNTIWNGERDRCSTRTSLPYDPPSQADWTQADGTPGYPGYKVGATVKSHQLWGGGSYVFNRNDPSIVEAENGFEVPNTPGVKMTHLLTVNLDALIRHVVNGVGDRQVDATRSGQPAYVGSYP